MRAVIGLGFRHPLLELLDAHGVQRMGAEKFRGAATALLAIVLPEALPEGDGGLGIVAGASHVNQPDAVRLGFLRPAVRQLPAHLGPESVSRQHQHAGARIGVGESRAQQAASGLQQQPFATACAISWPMTVASPASSFVMGRMPV